MFSLSQRHQVRAPKSRHVISFDVSKNLWVFRIYIVVVVAIIINPHTKYNICYINSSRICVCVLRFYLFSRKVYFKNFPLLVISKLTNAGNTNSGTCLCQTTPFKQELSYPAGSLERKCVPSLYKNFLDNIFP